jgi:hypothetical protein
MCITSATSYEDNFSTISTINSSSTNISPSFSSSSRIKIADQMEQVKVAIFHVERSSETGKVVSTKFIKEMWVEQKPHSDLSLIVASQIDLKEYSPEDLAVRTLHTSTFF